MTEIIERQLIGKRPDPRLCEDGIFVSGDFIAVIDGVTSKGVQRWQDGLSSGGYAKEIILRTLKDIPRETERDEFFKILDRALACAYSSETLHDSITEWLRACIVVYSDFYKQIWSLGDCGCMINGKYRESGKKIDEVLSDLRSLVIEKAVKDGMCEDELYSDDCGRQAITPFINMQLAFENDADSRFGYGVLNGHGVSESFIATYNLSQGDTVVLASDGYPELCDTLEKSERALEKALEADPHCFKKYPGTKGLSQDNCSFDDRSYIRFTVC